MYSRRRVVFRLARLHSLGGGNAKTGGLLARLCRAFSSSSCFPVTSIHRKCHGWIFTQFLADRTISRAFGTLCRLSVYRLSSVTFCIVAKRYVLAKNFLKELIGNQGQKVDFLGRRHISTSGFAATATEMVVFALFLPIQPSSWY